MANQHYIPVTHNEGRNGLPFDEHSKSSTAFSTPVPPMMTGFAF